MERIDYFYDEVLQEDELEQRENRANESKRRKRKRRRRSRRMLLILIVLLIVAYFGSQYSNIRIVELKGNSYYSKQEVMALAKIRYDMKSILAPSFLIEKRLSNDTMIKSASVHKSWNGVVSIALEEEKRLGYYEKEGKKYLLIESSEDILVKDVEQTVDVPFLNGLNEKQRSRYRKEAITLDLESLALISEVSHYETSYDKDMLQLTMQDGHIVRTTYEGLKMLDSYKEMLKGVKTDLKCIVFAEETNTMYTEKCD